MAHVAKVKSSGVSAMVGHYNREAERRGYRRDNIDSSRTPENYVIGAPDGDALAGAVRARVGSAVGEHERLTGKALRKDANVVMDWVVTLPKDCPEGLQEKFFETVVRFIQERYGAENVPGGFVHLDEATPHVHVPVVPVRDGRLQASKVINRADLKAFHGDLGRAVDAALGVHVSIELDEDRQGEKQLSHLGQAEYVAAREEAARAAERAAAAESAQRAAEDAQRAAEDRLECLQRGVEDAESLAAASLGEVRRVAREGGWAGGREQAARERNRELRERAEALRGACDAARGRGDSLEAEKAGSPAAIQDLERGVRRLEGEHRELARRVRALRRERCELGGRVRELEQRAEQLRGLLDRARGRLEGLAGRLAGLLTSAPDLARRLRPGSAELLRSWGMLPQAQERRRGRGMAR